MSLVDSKDTAQVNHPSHYNMNGIETIDLIKGAMSDAEYKGFLKGNVIKYLSRAEYKGNETVDYAKANWYLNKLLEEV